MESGEFSTEPELEQPARDSGAMKRKEKTLPRRAAGGDAGEDAGDGAEEVVGTAEIDTEVGRSDVRGPAPQPARKRHKFDKPRALVPQETKPAEVLKKHKKDKSVKEATKPTLENDDFFGDD
jgi:hypothetical protein